VTIISVVLRFQLPEVEERWFVSYLLVAFFSFFLFFLFLYQIVIMFKGTKDSCRASYGDKNPIRKRLPACLTLS